MVAGPRNQFDEKRLRVPPSRFAFFANLRAVVWANNRRVDVSLNTTGQKSVRQYPFNAKDSLELLSPSGGEKGKHAQVTRKKTSSPQPVKSKRRSN
jgi:hypothetical protein